VDTIREQIAAAARSLFARGLTHGSTGNIGHRTGSNILVTPTGVSLGELEADQLSLIGMDGAHLDGPAPTKEAFFHAAVLRARSADMAVVHTHSTHAVAMSVLAGVDRTNVFAPLTAYSVMRLGRVPVLPYHRPGDRSLEQLVESAARDHNALLLSNHGPVVAAGSLGAAVDALEELEETAKLQLLLGDLPTRPLTVEQVEEINAWMAPPAT
jgi:ribulose-5-phosphate 4-epimerase/fuculose-1-phosphate aldolase